MRTIGLWGTTFFGILGLAACGTADTGAGGSGAATQAAIGDPCAKDADCLEGGFCAADDPGGQCEKVCATQADCPSGSICTDELKCYKACSTDASCRTDGYACVDSMPSKTCDVKELAAIGDPCKADADCLEGGLCAVDDPGGQCEKVCATQADCPSGSTCTDELKCYKDCTSNADCRTDGYACVDSMTVTGTPKKTCDVAG